MAQAQFWRQNEDKKYCDKVATQLGHLCVNLRKSDIYL